MTGIPASPEKQTSNKQMSEMQTSSKLVKFFPKDINDVDESTLPYSPELNKYQEHVLLNKGQTGFDEAVNHSKE
eukprot:4306321-Ditylum_brightwellii.AAC.1